MPSTNQFIFDISFHGWRLRMTDWWQYNRCPLQCHLPFSYFPVDITALLCVCVSLSLLHSDLLEHATWRALATVTASSRAFSHYPASDCTGVAASSPPIQSASREAKGCRCYRPVTIATILLHCIHSLGLLGMKGCHSLTRSRILKRFTRYLPFSTWMDVAEFILIFSSSLGSLSCFFRSGEMITSLVACLISCTGTSRTLRRRWVCVGEAREGFNGHHHEPYSLVERQEPKMDFWEEGL